MRPHGPGACWRGSIRQGSKGWTRTRDPWDASARGPHDLGEVTIGFIRAGDEPGIEDDEVGLFALPSPRSCDTPAAREARAVVRDVLQLLPRTRVAAAFERSE